MGTSFSNTDNIDLRGFGFKVEIGDSTHLLSEVVKQFLSCDEIFGCHMPTKREKPLNMDAVIKLHENCGSPINPKVVIDVYDEIVFTIECLVEDLGCSDSEVELAGIERELTSLLNKIKKGRLDEASKKK